MRSSPPKASLRKFPSPLAAFWFRRYKFYVEDFTKVCRLDDLPPGKGKVVQVGTAEVYLFNREGHIYASCDRPRARAHAIARGGVPPGEAGSECFHPGSHFEAESPESPVSPPAKNPAIPVRIEGGDIYIDCRAVR